MTVPTEKQLVKQTHKFVKLFEKQPIWQSFELGTKFGPWRDPERRLLYIERVKPYGITYRCVGFANNKKLMVLIGKEDHLYPEILYDLNYYKRPSKKLQENPSGPSISGPVESVRDSSSESGQGQSSEIASTGI